LTEARLISEIDHPGVVEILDVIEQTHPLRVAYVMEHVEGPSLRRELDRRTPTPIEAARLGIQLTEALAAIHDHKVVHRDLKPANVLLTGRVDGPMFPQAKLADFGIAKAKDRPAPHKTATGLIIGTPTYMAPEQVSGEPVSAATDIYALGELLYEMFTKKRVFPEDQRTSLRMKLDPHPPPLDPLPFPNSGPVWEMIRACLDPVASKRPTHDQVADVLRMVDAAPIVDPAWVERPTQAQHTSTFAGPFLAEPLSASLAPSDPVTASSLVLESVEMPRPEPERKRWPHALAFVGLLAVLGAGVYALSRDPQESLP
ncbi:MAG: serine/threonine protein kinase, partial [Myxococcales bacterium]|nr:serine/threonine protein kinase [Myxococcales bacterium]